MLKPTIVDVVGLFPHSTVLKDEDGGFSLPLLAGRRDTLLFRVPNELPVGPDGLALMPGGFLASDDPVVREPFRTEFAVQVAVGWFEENVFHFGLGAQQVAVAVRWEHDPPEWAADGLESEFARQYRALWMERVSPQERVYMSKILQESASGEAGSSISSETGYDFWVLDRTDFYQEISKRRVSELLHATYRELAMKVANEIKDDPLLPEWSLKCGERKAILTMVDDHGETVTLPVSYEQIYLYGLDKYVEHGRARAREDQRRAAEAAGNTEVAASAS